MDRRRTRESLPGRSVRFQLIARFPGTIDLGYSGDRILIRHFRDKRAEPFVLREFGRAAYVLAYCEGPGDTFEIGILSPGITLESRTVRDSPDGPF